MPAGKRIPQGGGRYPSLRGALVVDTVRGSLRIRSWPTKRPGERHPTNEYWTAWLKAATYLYRYQPATVQWQMQEATKGTVWMPRDVFISAMRGRAFLLQDELGRKYHAVAFVNDVSDSLDAIAQLPGEMLFRGTDLWLPVPGGEAGQFLSYVSDSEPPVWLAPGGGSPATVRLVGGRPGADLISVNSTTYVTDIADQFSWDGTAFSFTEYRIYCHGRSNAVGQTIKVHLAKVSAPTVSLGASSDNLTFTSNYQYLDSGWITVPAPLTTFELLCIAHKGSNATVDFQPDLLEVHLR